MYKTIAIFTILVGSFSFADDKVITLAADPWCPWNCNDEKKPGITIEVAKAIYEPLGYQVKYIPIAWKDAIDKTVKGSVTALIGADHAMDQSNKFVFPSSAITVYDDVYILRTNSDFIFKDITSLKGKIIGIGANYHFGGVIGNYIDSNYSNSKVVYQAAGIDIARDNINELVNNRTDMYIDNRSVILYNANEMGVSDKIKIGGTLNEGEGKAYYVAFSLAVKNSTELASIYDAGVARLKANGEYQKIINKYIPTISN